MRMYRCPCHPNLPQVELVFIWRKTIDLHSIFIRLTRNSHLTVLWIVVHVDLYVANRVVYLNFIANVIVCHLFSIGSLIFLVHTLICKERMLIYVVYQIRNVYEQHVSMVFFPFPPPTQKTTNENKNKMWSVDVKRNNTYICLYFFVEKHEKK